MIHYVLACLMWAKPEVKVINIPIDEYGIAFVSENLLDYTFEISIMEERFNYMKVTYNPLKVSTQSNMPGHADQSMSLRLNVGDEQASLDCDIKQ